MRPRQDNRLIGVVFGGAIGALIGLAFIKFTIWGIPAGAVIGALIGLAVTSNTSRNPVGVDGEEIADVAMNGCMALSCLTDLIGCFGVIVLFVASVGILLIH